MPTAFGRAMLATINGQPQRFRMTMQNGPSIEMNCRDFLDTREEENQLLDGVGVPHGGTVLDWGCGVGRHLSRVRQRRASVHCYGIDICDLMLDYCRRTIGAPATFVATFEELAHREFDLIMLMGNGLGVLGSERDATQKLGALVHSLRRGGRIVIETGNPFSAGYYSAPFEIDYQQDHDGPFTWGYSDREWISSTLRRLRCGVRIEPSQAPGGMFFFATGTKGEQDGAANGAPRRR